jgi:hypothetical protein
LHAALDDRVLNANEFGKSRLHVCPLVSMSIFQLEMLFPVISARGKPARVFCEISRGRMPSPPAKVYRGGRGQGNAIMQKRGFCSRGAD